MSQTTPSTYPSAATEDAGAASPRGGTTSDALETAKDEAAQVTREASEQIKGLWRQTQSDLTDQAASQQTRATQGLRELAEQLQRMIDESSAEGPARDLVASTAQRGRDAAEWLDNRDPGSLLEEARGFARRRPGAFLAIAAGVGLLAGRLTRGLGDDDTNDTDFEGAAAPTPPTLSTGSEFRPAGTPAARAGIAPMSAPTISTPVTVDSARTDYGMDDLRGESTGAHRTYADSRPFENGVGVHDVPETDTVRGER